MLFYGRKIMRKVSLGAPGAPADHTGLPFTYLHLLVNTFSLIKDLWIWPLSSLGSELTVDPFSLLIFLGVTVNFLPGGYLRLHHFPATHEKETQDA